LTVDDQEVFRALARDVVEATPGFIAVGEVGDGESGIEAVSRLSPDVVLVDVRMPGVDGVEVARRLGASHPHVMVVLISIEEPVDVPSARRLPGVPFVRKQDFGPRLLRRIWAERVREGGPPGERGASPRTVRR
jgi:CheY-like chemotaxis protein